MNRMLPTVSDALERSPRISDRTTPATISTKKATATNASHLICWRTSPEALRNRTMIAAPARNAPIRMPIPATWVMASMGPARASIPSGFVTVTFVRSENAPVKRPGVTANAATVTVVAAIVNHRTGRHRRDGNFPSGNNRKSGMKIARTATISQRSNQAASRPNGSEPGWVTSACVA